MHSGKTMPSNASIPCLSPADAYRTWAGSYDRDPNPMLSLEKRYLEPLLPPVAELDVVDFGCGTGRWLEAFKSMRPKSLLGVDSSLEMLAVARGKLGRSANLVHADCTLASFRSTSADLILCNFLLSYIEEAQAFLANLSAMLRATGAVFITDVHPETARHLNWRRGVQVQDEFREIHTYPRSINTLVALCERSNLSVSVCLEPRFGAPEQNIFCSAGKQDYFENILPYPAIYILQLRKRKANPRVVQNGQALSELTYIQGARIALGSQASIVEDIRIDHSYITTLRNDWATERGTPDTGASINLSGYLVLPGLVNAHDHLEFALFPRLGKGGYRNFLEWAEDIHHPGASPVFEHRHVPREVRLWWGGIRNLLSGVTTVCHHNPYEARVFEQDFVVRVLREYGWAHSLTMDAEVRAKKRNTPKGQPFLVHLAEGVDEGSAKEIFELHRSGALDNETIIIHGLALGKKGCALLRAAGAGLIWCPSSNVFLFGRTLTSEEIRSAPRVAIGSDSPLTATGDLLDEVRFARENSGLRTEELYNFVTSKPSELLRLKNGEGGLRVGARGDLFAVRDTGLSPADTLIGLTYQDIELVLIGGRVQMASTDMIGCLPSETRTGLEPLFIEGTLRWIRAPIKWLFEQAKAHLPGEIRLGEKQVSIGN